MKKKSKRESRFRGELKKSFEFFGCFPIILFDLPFNGGTSFQHKRPFDMVVFGNQKVAALELKITTTKKFYFNRIEDHQLEFLYQVYSSGQSAFIVVNFRNKEYNINRAFMIPVKDVLEAIAEQKKGFSPTDCEDFIEMERVKVGRSYGWEIPNFFYEN